MKYPIDAEKYIAVMRIAFGENQESEQLHRETLIPLVNDFYFDGFQGENNNLGDPETMLADFAHSSDLKSLSKSTKKACIALIKWCRQAYAIGKQDATRKALVRKEEQHLA